MESIRRHALRRTLIVFDLLTLLAAIVFAYLLHDVLRDYISAMKTPAGFGTYLSLAYLVIPLWLALGAVSGLYTRLERPGGAFDDALALIKTHAVGLLIVGLMIYLAQLPINRSMVLLFVAISFSLMWLSRIVLRTGLGFEHRMGHSQLRVLIVTDAPDKAHALAASLQLQPLPAIAIGYLLPTTRTETSGDATIEMSAAASDRPPLTNLGHFDQLPDTLQSEAVDLVIALLGDVNHPALAAMYRECQRVGAAFRLSPSIDWAQGQPLRLQHDMGLPCIAFDARPRSQEALIVKRLFDIVVASMALILLMPLLLLTIGLIIVTMGRPIFIRQQRNGLNGRAFTMYKFRSMVVDAEAKKDQLLSANEASGPVFKIARDPRITPLGRILRKSSIDELPQLFNVLIGNMSLVGPRPLPVSEQSQISGDQRRRLSMKPGITGLWQVSGRSNIGFDEWMKLDLRYVDNWSLMQDFKLLLRTIPAVLLGRGAK